MTGLPVACPLPPSLRDAHADGRLAIMVGSGLSMARDVIGGFPPWPDLPRRILTDCRDLLVGMTDDHVAHTLDGLGYAKETHRLLATPDGRLFSRGFTFGPRAAAPSCRRGEPRARGRRMGRAPTPSRSR